MKTQAWGWLVTAVVAAGLNASYHDGGLEWAHRIADRVSYSTNAVFELATGRADQFLAEAQLIPNRHERVSCALATTLTRVETAFEPSDAEFDRLEAISDREQARLDKLSANRERIQAQVARIHIPAVAFSPVVVSAPKVSICPRVRVNLPQIPRMRMKMPRTPVVQVEMPGNGPV
jgi:hypothetical protein